MMEIYPDINDEVRNTADLIWSLAKQIQNPVDAANFINKTVDYYKYVFTPHEVEFLDFALHAKMEANNA